MERGDFSRWAKRGKLPKFMECIEHGGGGGGGVPIMGHCLIKGTFVHTDMGLKKIEEVQIGDKVLAWNENTSINEYKRVVNKFEATRKDMYSIYFYQNASPIIVSHNHKLYIKGKGWTEVSKIVEGDNLISKESVEVPIVKIIKLDYIEEVNVYDLQVEDYQNYYIMKEGILIHNKIWGSLIPGVGDPWGLGFD
jgi:intein/homing endonuclease